LNLTDSSIAELAYLGVQLSRKSKKKYVLISVEVFFYEEKIAETPRFLRRKKSRILAPAKTGQHEIPATSLWV